MSDPNIQTVLDDDGVLLATIDMPDRPMNVFSRDMMDSLEALIVWAETDDDVRSVVLTSGKSAFLAGADLSMIKMFTEEARTGSTDELNKLFGHLGRLFRRMELCSKPVVAALNGLALGGGLEVALACHARVVVDDPKIQLGLPEVKLGLLPGAGGTQRLTRLIGVEKGLDMLLTGNPVNPAEALELGLVDEVVPADQLIEAAKKRARAWDGNPMSRWDAEGAKFDSAPFDFSDEKTAFDQIAQTVGISDYQRKYYPAYHAIMGCVVGGWNLPMTEASDHEMCIFVELMRNAVAGNMVRTLFLNRQKAAKLGLLKPDGPFNAEDDALIPQISRASEKAKSLELSESNKLLASSLAALRAWAQGKADQTELADVAVVSAGLFPSYAGGPFTHLNALGAEGLAEQAKAAASNDSDLFAVDDAVERYFASLAAKD